MKKFEKFYKKYKINVKKETNDYNPNEYGYRLISEFIKKDNVCYSNNTNHYGKK